MVNGFLIGGGEWPRGVTDSGSCCAQLAATGQGDRELDLKDQPYRQGGRKHAQTDDSHFEMKIAVHVGSLLRTDDRTVTESWALQGAGLRSRAL